MGFHRKASHLAESVEHTETRRHLSGINSLWYGFGISLLFLLTETMSLRHCKRNSELFARSEGARDKLCRDEGLTGGGPLISLQSEKREICVPLCMKGT
ncbi:hypothetical protein QQF64_032822 [Cirrhinus molitorella]|uniref:Uncharacterized protein n=1 Tax=Cirrhinus molitorella TaxID=172907 RepID=A0ABR3MS46_9TELE